MISRKTFLLAGLAAAAAVTVIGKAKGVRVTTGRPIKKGNPATALVFWYSQTGNTERIGKAIATAWNKSGLSVVSGDYRDIDRNSLDKYDLIAAGTPVFYYEVPENFREWIKGIPRIDGTPVASFGHVRWRGGQPAQHCIRAHRAPCR